MDYKEKYEQALEVAQRFYNNSVAITKKGLEDIFPELKESEDERIRKEMIFYFQEEIPQCSIQEHADKMKEFIAWLERQGEQKSNPVLDIEIPFGAKDSELQEASYYIPEGFHAEIESNRVVIKRGEQKPAWSEEDENINECIQWTLIDKQVKEKEPNKYNREINWLKSLKDRVQPQPKQEWSEEDSKMLNSVMIRLRQLDHYWNKPTDNKMIDWLKSIRHQSHWKPSVEQMKALEKECIAHSNYDLCRLLEDLKKLTD